ncbi:MAG: hypothetical protein ACRD1N_09740 [Terriglobia bacterium]
MRPELVLTQANIWPRSHGWRVQPLLLPLLLGLTAAAWAQSGVRSPEVEVPLTVSNGVPLQVILTERVPIKRAGVPVQGKLAAPVYVYNRTVLPAGCEVLGHVSSVKSASRWQRARAITAGDFTPLRTAQVEFDTLVLKDGERLPISTEVAPGAAPMIHLESGGGKAGARRDPVGGMIGQARQQISAEKKMALESLRAPDKLHRLALKLKAIVVAKSPYHRQAFAPGTVFTAELLQPLKLGTERLPQSELARVGSMPPPDSIVHARLVESISSATAHRGTPVLAVVTQPLFSSHDRLIIPQGSRLEGMVIQAKPARRLHRDGKLRFTFQRLEPPAPQPRAAAAVEPRSVNASLQGVDVARATHLKVDAEGGVKPAVSKGKYLIPALSIALAAWTDTPDRDAVSQPGAAVPGQGGVVGQTVAGGWSLGWIGSAVSVAAQSRVLTATFGFYGAAWSVYSHLLARGRDVTFPANTPLEIRLGSHAGANPRLTAPSPANRG